MSNDLLTLFQRSGDAHVGQTLTRLAGLAAAAHRFEQTQELMNNEPARPETTHPTEQADASPLVHPPRTDAGVIHREVDR